MLVPEPQEADLIDVLEQSAAEREAENIALYWRCVEAENQVRKLEAENAHLRRQLEFRINMKKHIQEYLA